jgi:ribonuclease BN (tRNA processing enzyme)
MELTVVGARAGMPTPGEPSSGYVLRVAGRNLLFDCGPGVAGALPGVVPPEEIAAGFVSHLHLDHCYDLLPLGKGLLHQHLAYPSGPVAPELDDAWMPVPLYVPAGSTSVFKTLQGLFPVVSSPALDRAFELAFDLREMTPWEPVDLFGCRITAMPLRHAVPAFGFRIESPDGVFAYTGDTGWTESLHRLADGADILLCEATLRTPDHGPHGHLCGEEAGRLAAEAGVGMLVITHVTSTEQEWLDGLRKDASAAFSGTIHLATPGARFAYPAPREE